MSMRWSASDTRGAAFRIPQIRCPTASYDSREAATVSYAFDPGFSDWQRGQVVTVFYDPLDPAESVLQTSAGRLPWAVCLVGAGLLGIAAWEGWRLRRRAATS